uniref:Interleukin-2 receptor subunit alpha n=1 Tax=Naja naja TaxID=35670 RepID=A0A8C6X9Z8_NAJNA
GALRLTCRSGLFSFFTDECPEPDTTQFGEYYMDQYVVGTWVRYNCVEGYKRHGGRSNIIICRKVSGVISVYYFLVFSLSLCPPPLGFCGVPVPLKHATAKVMKYKVGQKLTFKHLNGSQARAPIPGIITCENSCGIAAWSSLNPQCTDDIGLVSGKQCLNAGKRAVQDICCVF